MVVGCPLFAPNDAGLAGSRGAYRRSFPLAIVASMQPQGLVTLALFLFLLLAPPVWLFLQVRSGEVRWGHRFGFPHAKRSANPGLFWTLIAFQLIVMLAMWAADVLIVLRGH